MRAVLIAAACLVGCYSPHYGDCEVACASNVCPSGLECQDGMCRAEGMTGACGLVMPDAGSGSGGAIPLADLAAAQRDALCTWLVRCHSFEDLETCRSSFGVQFQIDDIIAGVAAGKVKYDGDKARQCVSSFAQSTCERARAFSNRDIDPVCNEVFSGTLPAQSQCYFSEECISQDCQKQTNCPNNACCVGACQGSTAPGRPTLGQPCGSRDACVDSYCPTTANGVCTAYKQTQAPCTSSNECAPGLSCVGSVCRQLTATNGNCMTTTECANLADVCLNNVCSASGLLGTMCPGTSDACQLMHHCSTSGTTTGQCLLPPKIGEVCNTYPCREGYCGAAGICVDKLQDGATCDQASGPTACQSGYCEPTASTCQTRPICN